MQLAVGSILEGKVTGITKFGAFIDLGEGKTGMVHISEVASSYVKEITDHISENQVVKVKVLNISPDGKIGLSIKKAQETPAAPVAPVQRRPHPRANSFEAAQRRGNENLSFEDMLSRFKQTSDDKMSDLKKTMDGKRGSFNRRGSNR